MQADGHHADRQARRQRGIADTGICVRAGVAAAANAQGLLIPRCPDLMTPSRAIQTEE
jgi:hypothetical protein